MDRGDLLALLANRASFAQDLNGETDRAVVVIVAARLDELLKDVIQRKLIEPRTKKDSLVNGLAFKSRIELAYRLGLLPAMLVEPLMKLADLRNTFAHRSRRMELIDAETAVRDFIGPIADVVQRELEIRGHAETATLRDEFLIAATFVVETVSEQVDNAKRLTTSYRW